jgi:hypothetical protein
MGRISLPRPSMSKSNRNCQHINFRGDIKRTHQASATLEKTSPMLHPRHQTVPSH